MVGDTTNKSDHTINTCQNEPAKKKSKRTNIACERCRKRHVKCPQGQPCAKCVATKAICQYAESETKINVSMKYLTRLHDEIASLKKENTNLRCGSKQQSAQFSPLCNNVYRESSSFSSPSKETQIASEEIAVPPLLDASRRLVYSTTGDRFYVGPSSMTLFGVKVQQMIPKKISANVESNGEMKAIEKMATVMEREGQAYKVHMEKTETRPEMSVKFTLPNYSYAMLLIDTFITFNDGCFYFFNEGLVKQSLRDLYRGQISSKLQPSTDSVIEAIHLCKLLLIFAIGEMYLGVAHDANGAKLNESDEDTPGLPGSSLFQQASKLFTGLFASGAIDNVAREGGVEVVLLYAFYLQVADSTVASYFYFGIALRASLILGMHVDAEKENLTRFELEHRRRIWWTVYMFERMLSPKIGQPLSLSDDSISTDLPLDFPTANPPSGCEHYIFPEAQYIKNCVSIVQINALIFSSMYQNITNDTLPSMLTMLKRLHDWKQQLPEFLNPNFLLRNFKISRLVTNLITEYFQGVNLAVRPLLFYMTTKQIKEGKMVDLTKFDEILSSLLNASFQGSINTIRALWYLHNESMLAVFGYMDREYLFTSAATLVLFNRAFGVNEATYLYLDHALFMFSRMRSLGNNPAQQRRAQLINLMHTLNYNQCLSDLIKKYEDDDVYESTRAKTAAPEKVTNINNKEKRKKMNSNRFTYQRQKWASETDQNNIQENGIYNISDLITAGRYACRTDQSPLFNLNSPRINDSSGIPAQSGEPVFNITDGDGNLPEVDDIPDLNLDDLDLEIDFDSVQWYRDNGFEFDNIMNEVMQ